MTNSRSHTLRFTTKALETICSFLVVRTARITNRLPARRRKEMGSVMLPVFGDEKIAGWIFVCVCAPTSLIKSHMLHPLRWLPVEESILKICFAPTSLLYFTLIAGYPLRRESSTKRTVLLCFTIISVQAPINVSDLSSVLRSANGDSAHPAAPLFCSKCLE